MMRVLFDTNVVLDALLNREPWAGDTKHLWEAHRRGDIRAHMTATTVTDAFYIARRERNRDVAWDGVRICIDQLGIIGVGQAELAAAALMPGNDFEDNLQIACAIAAELDAIVTRDPNGFTGAPIEVWSPVVAVEKIRLADRTSSPPEK
jgi:predicted nucleic acid-binding protein